MADDRVIATKLEQLEEYHHELVSKRASLDRQRFLDDTTEQRAVERMFEIAIQSCADMALHIATRDYGYGGDIAKEAVRLLGEEDVLDEATTDGLVAAIGFRNILAHEYGRIDYDEVYDLLQDGLGLYDRFGRQIASWSTSRH